MRSDHISPALFPRLDASRALPVEQARTIGEEVWESIGVRNVSKGFN